MVWVLVFRDGFLLFWCFLDGFGMIGHWIFPRAMI
jgi:hypothetical protein